MKDPKGAAVRAIGLQRHFDGTEAVEGLDLQIDKGEIYGFLGPNGAGKSTTVRMLCTLLAPTGGQAFVAGHDVATEPGAVRLRIGAALQDVALDPKQTGRELLRLQGRLYGLKGRTITTRVDQLGELIDLGDALDHRIATYSGGMKRGSTSRPRWCTTPKCCSSTSRRPVSTRSVARGCGPRSCG